MIIEFLTLFALAFASATLLPGGSEIYLSQLVLQTLDENHSPTSLLTIIWLVATVGNTLGSALNYALGRYFLHFQKRKWFPVSDKQLLKAQHWFQKYGRWSLLMSWAPIIGDALTLLAGIMKIPFWTFFSLVLIGKGFRYAFVIALVAGFIQ